MNHSVKIEYKEPHCRGDYSYRSEQMFYSIRDAQAHVYHQVGKLNKKGGVFKVHLNDVLVIDSVKFEGQNENKKK